MSPFGGECVATDSVAEREDERNPAEAGEWTKQSARRRRRGLSTGTTGGVRARATYGSCFTRERGPLSLERRDRGGGERGASWFVESM